MKKTAEQVVSKAVVVVSTIMGMIGRFLELKSTTFIQLWQKTENITGMKKTKDNDGVKRENRFVGKVYKLNCLNAVTNYNYEAMVNKARSKEAMAELRAAMVSAGVPDNKIDAFFKGAKSDISENAETFKASKNNVGTSYKGSRCILENTPDAKGSSQWAGVHGYYIQLAILNYATPVYKWIATDETLTDAELAEMKKFITPKKDEGKKQGLEKPYVIRSPRFETIQSITLNKHNYKLNP